MNKRHHFKYYQLFWGKKRIFFIIFVIIFFGGSIGLHYLIHPEDKMFLFAFYLFFIPFFLYVITSARKSYVRDSEFTSLEKRFEKEADDLIIQAFGGKKYFELFEAEMNQLDLCGTKNEYIKLLKEPPASANELLRFHLFVKLAKFYIKDGRYEESIECLKNALSIKADSLVVNMRLAIASERAGNGDDAIKYYEEALKDNTIKTDHLKKYIFSQIERVKEDGPQKKPLIDGYRWLCL
ncbi:MAG: tetratricopeptide repeat protein [Syntrophaceae bacterium]|nr:tetratricopeptide repeat protein [Syntrophaceae bacterium]